VAGANGADARGERIDAHSFQEAQRLRRLWILQLYREFDAVCYHYKIKLKPPVIVLNESREKLGTWDQRLNQISISASLIEDYRWSVVVEILKHEIAHQIVSEEYGSADNHGPDFLRACRRIGVESWAQSARVDMYGELSFWKDQTPTDEQSRLRRRTEKLLALATSSNEHEALLAMKKVREIYESYNLDQIAMQRQDDFVSLVINHQKKKTSAHQSMIASILTRHFFSRIIFASEYSAQRNESFKTMEIMGTRENVLMAEYVYWFLINNLKVLWSNFQKAGSAQGTVSKNNFYMGVLVGFSEQLSLQSPSPTGTIPIQPSTRNELMKIADAALSE
jgi:hypothetical protein